MKHALFVLLAFVVAAAGIYFWPKARAPELPLSSAAQVDRVNQEDLVLLQSQADDFERAKALRRMASQNSAQAQVFVRQLRSDLSPSVRAAAYESAGGFEGDEWETLIGEGLDDPQGEVRVATLKGLRRQLSPARGERVESFLKISKRTEVEQLWALLALWSLGSEKSQLAQREKKILALLSRVGTKEKADFIRTLQSMAGSRCLDFGGGKYFTLERRGL